MRASAEIAARALPPDFSPVVYTPVAVLPRFAAEGVKPQPPGTEILNESLAEPPPPTVLEPDVSLASAAGGAKAFFLGKTLEGLFNSRILPAFRDLYFWAADARNDEEQDLLWEKLDEATASTQRPRSETLEEFLDGSGEASLPATHAAAAMVCNQFVRVATLPAVPAAFGESSSRLILSRKWGAIDALLGRGVRVLYADVDVVLTHPPFWLASNDSDVEASSEAWDAEAARGFIHVSPEPAAALKPSPSLALLALLSVHAAPVTSESHHRVPPATGSG